MSHYADSSFLVSCYIVDANAPGAKARLSSTGSPLTFTALHGLEIRNAFKLGIFRGLLAAVNATAAWSDAETDLRSGLLLKTAVKWPLVFRIPARLSEPHSAAIGTRSIDILHVAAAKAMRSVGYVSFDTRQRALAATFELKVAA